jgi:hypothetical protein
MKQMMLSSRKVHTDDTPITVLDPNAEPVHSRRGYMWVYISEYADVVFDYTRSRKRDGPASFLKEYRGYLQADAFSGYDGIYAGGLIVEVACWAHARRKFYDTLVHYPAEAERVLERIGSLYAVESRAKKLHVPDDRRLAWRQRFGRRRLERLRRYLDELSVKVLPKSPLGKAISYTLIDQKLSVGVEMQFEHTTEKGSRSDPEIEFLIGPSLQWRPTPRTPLDLVPLIGTTTDAPRVEAFVVFGIELGAGQARSETRAPVSTKSR